jgi:hypothetical protein
VEAGFYQQPLPRIEIYRRGQVICRAFAHSADLVHRTVLRAERIEPVQSRLAYLRGDAGGALAVQPVPRVVLKQVSVERDHTVTRARQSGVLSSNDTLPTRPSIPKEPGTGAVDLSRLTMEVIQNIDRQIIAERERMGRV